MLHPLITYASKKVWYFGVHKWQLIAVHAKLTAMRLHECGKVLSMGTRVQDNLNNNWQFLIWQHSHKLPIHQI